MSAKGILLACFCMCLIASVTTFILLKKGHQEVCVVDTIKLFDAFDMKKELEARDRKKLQEMGHKVDSIDNLLKTALVVKNEPEILRLGIVAKSVKAELDAFYTQSNHDINEQVWKRLNPYLTEFGKKMNVHIIIGANGMGTVLYNEASYDVTDEVIKFVNRKYEAGN